jgi:PAS domain S-box-containing protein
VLAIERDPDTRARLEASLDGAAFEVRPVVDGPAALEVMRQTRSDAALLAVGQPAASGLEALRFLKAEPLARRLPVVVVGFDEESQVQAFEAGADDCLIEPIRPRELATRLRARIAHGHGLALEAEGHEALLELSRLLASSLDMGELLHLVAVRTAEVLRVSRCALVFLEPDTERAVVAAASEDASVHDLTIQLRDYPEIREVIRTRRPLVVARVEEHPSLQGILPVLATKRVGSLALFPMIREARVDGVLFLRSGRFERKLEERDLVFADAVASSVALAVRNVRIADELRRTKQFLERLIDSSADAILAADPQGRLMIWNQGAERLLGFKADELVGRQHLAEIFPPGPDSPVTRLLVREPPGSATATTQRLEVTSRSGELIPVQMTAWSVQDGGREVATAAVLSDLRERLRTERKLSQAQERLMRSEQQSVLAELAGAMAHELNQPLTSILGYAEMAKRKREDAREVARMVDIVITEAERMADLVRKIGRITRYETKSYVGEQRIVDLERASEPSSEPEG